MTVVGVVPPIDPELVTQLFAVATNVQEPISVRVSPPPVQGARARRERLKPADKRFRSLDQRHFPAAHAWWRLCERIRTRRGRMFGHTDQLDQIARHHFAHNSPAMHFRSLFDNAELVGNHFIRFAF